MQCFRLSACYIHNVWSFRTLSSYFRSYFILHAALSAFYYSFLSYSLLISDPWVYQHIFCMKAMRFSIGRNAIKLSPISADRLFYQKSSQYIILILTLFEFKKCIFADGLFINNNDVFLITDKNWSKLPKHLFTNICEYRFSAGILL